jgi:hypothetical protein
MDQIITQQALSQGEQDIVPAVGSGRLLHDVDEEEGERQNNNAGVGRRQTSNTGRGMKALSPSIKGLPFPCWVCEPLKAAEQAGRPGKLCPVL